MPVPDPRLDKLAEIWETDKKTPAIVEFVDIAGLVKGASQGAGLGNKFLGHIRECDAIVHVVRCFDDDNIIHVVEDVNKPESVDPIRDIDAIDTGADSGRPGGRKQPFGPPAAKAAKTGNKAAAAEAAWLADLAAWLEAGKPARSFAFDESDDAVKATRKELGLLSAKPVIYACNVGEDDLLGGLDENPYYPLVARPAPSRGKRRGYPHLRQDRGGHRRLHPGGKNRVPGRKWALNPRVWTSLSRPATSCWDSSAS